MKNGWLLVLTLIFLLTSCENGLGEGKRKEEPAVVIHGGGEVWGYDGEGQYRAFPGTNSREALFRCADEGQRVVELDFSLTADMALVCLHDWEGHEAGTPLLLEDFRASRLYGQFSPLTAAEVLEVMVLWEDMVLVTDFKDDFALSAALLGSAAEERGLTDRIVVQIYHPQQYHVAQAAGFQRIAYTLYALNWEEKTDTAAHISFAKENRLEWIAFDASLLSVPTFVENVKKTGIPLYVHTVNDGETAELCRSLGIDGIYTDRRRQKYGRID